MHHFHFLPSLGFVAMNKVWNLEIHILTSKFDILDIPKNYLVLNMPSC